MQLNKLRQHLQETIKPNLSKIHKQGFYPKDSLKKMGEYGLYSSLMLHGQKGLLPSILGIAEVSRVCANTGFCTWCQNVLIWYLIQTDNTLLRQELLESLSYGKILGGTGLSNPIKSYANLERNFLKAKKINGGFLINGTLPWVSNIEQNHIFGVVCNLDAEKHNIAGVIRCNDNNHNIELKNNITFIALEGSATKSIILKNYFMPYSDILGLPAEAFLLRITGGFLLLQMGLALGCLDLAIYLIQKTNTKKSHINSYLPISESYLQHQRMEIMQTLTELTNNFEIGNQECLKVILELRVKISNVVLESTQSAMLHAGSKSYRTNSLEHKLLLESYFVALISPSLKHLYKELDDIKKGGGVAKKWQQIVKNFDIAL